MDRHLIVVTRNQVSLCDYLRQQFFEDKDVEVILDRRRGQRRRSVRVCERERRRADRQPEPSREADLRTHGFMVIRRKPEAVGLGEIEQLLGELQEQIGRQESFPQGNGTWKRRSPGAVTREELPPPLRTTSIEQEDWQKVLHKIGLEGLRLPDNGALCTSWRKFLNELGTAT